MTSRQHGQPCTIDCSGHSLVGGGGSQPEQSMLVASFGGTKVWVFVFFKANRTQSVGVPLANRGGKATDSSRGSPEGREPLSETVFYIWRCDSWGKDNTSPVLGVGNHTSTVRMALAVTHLLFTANWTDLHVVPSSLRLCLLYEWRLYSSGNILQFTIECN